MWCALRGPPLLGTILDEEFLDCNTTGRITSSASGIGVDCRLMNAHEALRRASRLTADVAAEVRRRFGTPCYVYDRAALEAAARQALAFPAPFGFTLRYAMKANPSRGVLQLFRDLGLHVDRVHSHIGSGTDPEVWQRCARMTLDLVAQLPEVGRVNLGGGFKVGRMPEEPSVDLADVGAHVRREIEAFRERDGRALHLEIEPGTLLVANAGAIVASCVDVVGTGADGYLFAKLDAGMPEITRPSLYGAQHPIDVLAAGRDQAAVVFVGPCCESGDILTPAPGDPEALMPRWVPRPEIGDLVVIGGAGAYCAAMATINYNSYPQAPEVMLEPDGALRLLRRRQSPEQVWQNEL